MAVLADKNPSLTVKVVDKNNERINAGMIAILRNYLLRTWIIRDY